MYASNLDEMARPTPTKRVLLVDDNAVVRFFVRQLFESQPHFEISGEAENGTDAVEKAGALNPT